MKTVALALILSAVSLAQEDDARVLTGHSGAVRAIAFNPDGKRIASADDKSLRLWDAESGKEVFTASAEKPLRCVAFAPDGKTLATGDADGVVRIWDAASGKPISALEALPSETAAISFRHDGKFIASGGGRAVRVTELATAKKIAELRLPETASVLAVAYSPGGKYVAFAGTALGNARVWDPGADADPFELPGDAESLECVAFSSDGKTLAAAGADGKIRTWSVAERKETGVLWAQWGTIRSIAFSSSGAALASAGADNNVTLWNMPSSERVATLSGHTDKVTCVAFSSEGKWVASAGADKTVRLWGPKSRASAAARPFKFDFWESWNSFGVGSSVTHESVTSMMPDMKTLMKTTSTKKESDKILGIRSVKTGDTDWMDMPEAVIAEKSRGGTYECPKCKDAGKKHKIGDQKEGKDSVMVAGKKIDCATIEMVIYDCDEKQIGQAKTWYSKEVPGNLVKSWSKMTMGGSTMEATMTCTAFEKK